MCGLQDKMYINFIVLLVMAASFTMADPQNDETKVKKSEVCASYLASAAEQFVPITKAISDDISLFMAGKDKGGENMYFCKVNYDGKIFLGRGRGNDSCFVADGKHEATFRSGYHVLAQPTQRIKLTWKNITNLERIKTWSEAQALLESVQAVKLGDNSQASGVAGMCEEDPDWVQDVPYWRRRPPVIYPTPYNPAVVRDKRWIISEENERKKRITGFLQTNANSTVLKITWGGDVLLCNSFTVLTCQERPN